MPLSGENIDTNSFSDSFHMGGPNVPALHTALNRPFKPASIAFEYVFAAIETASS